ncbi:MAG: hypothetical protein LBR74_02520 [Eubacterium sp.]|nr:hypothetical protein [Eubacterium sp.]
MKAIEYLNQAGDIDKLIAALREQQKQLCDSALSGVRLDSVLGFGAKSDRTANIGIKLATLQESIDDYEKQALELKSEIIDNIMKLKNRVLSTLLMHRYINGKDWYEIGELINYNPDYTRKLLHKAAIKEFERILES